MCAGSKFDFVPRKLVLYLKMLLAACIQCALSQIYIESMTLALVMIVALKVDLVIIIILAKCNAAPLLLLENQNCL